MKPLISTALLLTCCTALTACSASGGVRKTPRVPPTPPASSAPAQPSSQAPTATSAAPPQSPPASASPAPTKTATPSSAAAPTKPVGCTPAEVSGSFSAGNGAAGTDYFDLVITNVSNTTCTLKGYPRAQVVAHGNGTQVGKDAAHSYWDWQGQEGKAHPVQGQPNPQLTLQPGAKAYANFALPSIYNYAVGKAGKDPYSTKYNSQCGSAVKADGLRVYLPGEQVSLYVAMSKGFAVCAKSPAGQPFTRVSEFVQHATAE